MTLEMQASTEPQPSPASRKRKIQPVWGKTLSRVSLVWRCWVLGLGSCSAVRLCSQRRVLNLLTAFLQTVGEDICCSSSTTLHSIHFIPYSYPFPLLGKQLSTSGSIPGFIKLKGPLGGLGGRLAAVSILFVPFWKSPL